MALVPHAFPRGVLPTPAQQSLPYLLQESIAPPDATFSFRFGARPIPARDDVEHRLTTAATGGGSGKAVAKSALIAVENHRSKSETAWQSPRRRPCPRRRSAIHPSLRSNHVPVGQAVNFIA